MSQYFPNFAVRSAHRIPRLLLEGTHLQLVSHDFNISKQYVNSTLTFPVIFLVVGLLSIILFLVLLGTRCCFHKLSGYPSHIKHDTSIQTSKQSNSISKLQYDAKYFKDMSNEEFRSWKLFIIYSKGILLCFTIIGLCFVIFGNQVIFYGSDQLTTSLNILSNAFDNINNLYTSFNFYLQSINQDILTIAKDVNAINSTTSCGMMIHDEYQSFSNITESFNQLNSIVSQSSEKIDSLRSDLQTHGMYSKDVSLFVFYSVIMIISMIYILGLYFTNKIISQVGISLSVIVISIYTIVCAIEMVIVVSVVLYLIRLYVNIIAYV